MSEAEEFSRMSELAEVSDEDDFNEVNASEYDDIPEADEELGTWEENEVVRQDVTDDDASMKSKSKPYVKYFCLCNVISILIPTVFIPFCSSRD